MFRGVNARHLLQQKKNLELLLVDLWSAYPAGGYRQTGDYQSRFSQERWDYVFEKVLPRHLGFANDRFVIDRRDSAEAAGAVRDRALDFVFIDGDHSYKAVSRDITCWASKVKPGGFIGGHDYNHPKEGSGYGVQKAVDRFARQLAVKIEVGDDRTWFLSIDHTLAQRLANRPAAEGHAAAIE